MPLDCQDKVLGRVQFHSLNHAIFGRNGADQEIIAQLIDRLMVGRVHERFRLLTRR